MADAPTFSIQLGALRAAVALAARAVTHGSKVPILDHLHLAAEGGRLTVTGTDLNRQISATAEGDGALPPVTASGARLRALLARLPAEETATLSRAREGQLVLAAGPVTAKLFNLDAGEFPLNAPAEPEVWTSCWRIPAGDLRALLEKTRHAMSTEETRYYLNGVYLHVPEGSATLTATATDGHRLMIARATLPDGDAPLAQILPRDAVRNLLEMLRAVPPGRPMEVRQGGAQGLLLGVSGPGWSLTTKTIDGTFPDYARVLPEEGLGTPLAVDDPRRLAEAIQTVTAIRNERSLPVKLCNGTGAALRLEAWDPEGGDCELAVPAEVAAWRSNGPHPEVGFQARYLLDLCRVFGAAGFVAQVQGPDPKTQFGKPMRIDGAAGTAVLMPMRV